MTQCDGGPPSHLDVPYRGVLLGLLLGIAVGCGGEGEVANGSVHAAPGTGPSAAFDVHEWGLIAVDLGDTTWRAPARDALRPRLADGFGGLGLGITGHGAAGGKPVLYVHLGDGVERVRFRAQVRVTGGSVPEHFPLGELIAPGTEAEAGRSAGQGVLWADVLAERGSCRGTYPSVRTEACRTIDHYCERAELSQYETDDSACLQVGQQRGGLLFYRGAGGRSRLPLQVTREGDAIRVANSGRASGSMFVVLRGVRRDDTRVDVLDVPAPGQSVLVRRPPPDGTNPDEGLLARLVEPMARAGLTRAEVAAFRRAWDVTLFGRPSPEAGSPASAFTGLGATHPLSARQVTLLYWLPAADIDAAFPLEITPAPRTIRRMVLVRVDLDPRAPIGSGGGGLSAANATRAGSPVDAERVEVRPAGAAVVEGPLNPEIVRRVVRRHLREMRHCAEQDPGEYTLDLDMRLSPEGRVLSSTVATPEVPPRVRTCLARTARRWRFPSTDRVTSVRFPLSFTLRAE